ncbi:MAG: hypothetical protein Q7S40_17650 [Opitutaceae bacterium]|nr:hypothetical protein [Opitutaceae bacterium]
MTFIENRRLLRVGVVGIDCTVKLVKRQMNGGDRVVLKREASLDDLHAEAARLERMLGYHVQLEKPGRYVATHDFYRGKYVLELAPD